jgi:hypothetical protein
VRSGVRVTGVVLLAVVLVGVAIRVVSALRLGRSGSDTVPFSGRSNPGNTVVRSVPIGFAQQASTTRERPDARRESARGIVSTRVEEEETEVAVKEPGISASPNRGLALTVGTLFAIWGFLGFFFAAENADHAFFGPKGGLLWNAFGVNPAMAAIWVLMAALLFIVGLGNTIGSRNANILVGIVALVLGVYGFVFMNTSANIFAMNTVDNVFHVIVGVILLLTALGADKQNIRALRAAARA